MNKKQIGPALSALGIAIFGIPAAIAVSGNKIPVPSWLVLSCCVAGLVIIAFSHFYTTVFLSGTDAKQQAQLDDLADTVKTQTDFVQRALGPVTPGQPKPEPDKPPTK